MLIFIRQLKTGGRSGSAWRKDILQQVAEYPSMVSRVESRSHLEDSAEDILYPSFAAHIIAALVGFFILRVFCLTPVNDNIYY
jgi:hypothetical protein